MRSSIQVTVVLAAALLAAASASPAGLGGFLGGSKDSAEEPARLPSLPNPVAALGAFLNGNRNEHGHHHHHEASGAPRPVLAEPSRLPTDVGPPHATDAAPTTAAAASTTAAAVSTTSAAPTSAAPTTAAAAQASETTLEPRSAMPALPSSGNATLDKCRNNWLALTNSSVNENTDILSVLLENGGFPGQLDGKIKWERNATQGKPDRWTYFWGDTDYKTYIRAERGEINSKSPPVQGATPEALEGNVWWTPEDFCGKLRHAIYTQDPELRASNQPKVCFIEGERVTCWLDPNCVEPLAPGTTCPRGGASGALMASLVG